MLEYSNWLSRFEYLEWQSWQTMTFYFFLALIFLVGKYFVFLKFLYIQHLEAIEKRYSVHGRPHPNSLEIIYLLIILALGVTVGPFMEEIMFRGPILWFILGKHYMYALIVFIFSTVIFMAGHLLETRGSYSDGTLITYTKPGIYSTGVGGIFYGLLVFLTDSLWPSIFLHLLWNIASLGQIIFADKLNEYARSLQR